MNYLLCLLVYKGKLLVLSSLPPSSSSPSSFFFLIFFYFDFLSLLCFLVTLFIASLALLSSQLPFPSSFYNSLVYFWSFYSSYPISTFLRLFLFPPHLLNSLPSKLLSRLPLLPPLSLLSSPCLYRFPISKFLLYPRHNLLIFLFLSFFVILFLFLLLHDIL